MSDEHRDDDDFMETYNEIPTPPAKRPRTVHRRPSAVLYIVLLFLVAVSLILISYFMQQRNNDQMLNGLNESVSAMQSITQLQEDNQTLRDEVDGLEEQLAAAQAEARSNEEALNRAEQERERSNAAMDWFWQINEAYVRGRYTSARELIEQMAAAGLTAEDLPAESVTDTGRFSPRDRYQEIYDSLY